MKKLIFSSLAFLLIFSLMAVACAPKAPVGDVVPKADLTKAQADLAAEKQKTTAAETKAKDLEAQLAAAQKPAKVYRWEPAGWQNAGSSWDGLVYVADYLNKMSDGRFNVVPSSVGAVCPVEEQIEAVSAGTTGAMAPAPSYYAGKLPVSYAYSTPVLGINVEEMIELDEVYEDGRIAKLWWDAVEKTYNVEVAGEIYVPTASIISSRVPIRCLADLKGKKFRCGDQVYADPLKAFGASTVWFPGSEIYTSLATGVIDAFTYGSAYVHYSNSFHEVTSCWVKKPALGGPHCDTFVVNRDVWNDMSDDLKEMVKVAVDAASMRLAPEGWFKIQKSWKAVAEAGVEVVEWPLEDQKAFKAKQLELAQQFSTDPAHQELLDLTIAWGKLHGYLE